jgi:tRNA pseudouridine38-40 synthase
VPADPNENEPANRSTDGGLVRVRIDLAYDGTDFSGWARQPGLRSVQETLEEALVTVLRLTARAAVTVAGRTDAGVHARQQVVHVDIPAEAWCERGELALRLARILPRDIRVSAVDEAPDGFDARFSALARRYAYRISDGPLGPDPLTRRFVWWHRRPLDVQRLNAASEALVGLHDFAAFCRHRPGGSTIRALHRLCWARDDSGLLVGTVEADAFCHSMVRSLVGSLVPAGEGRRHTDWPAQVLSGRVRDPAVNVVPARGLTLESVTYPPPEALAQRADETRRPRRPH